MKTASPMIMNINKMKDVLNVAPFMPMQVIINNEAHNNALSNHHLQRVTLSTTNGQPVWFIRH